MTGNQAVNLWHLTQKFPGGPIKFQEISRSCRHPDVIGWYQGWGYSAKRSVGTGNPSGVWARASPQMQFLAEKTPWQVTTAQAFSYKCTFENYNCTLGKSWAEIILTWQSRRCSSVENFVRAYSIVSAMPPCSTPSIDGWYSSSGVLNIYSSNFNSLTTAQLMATELGYHGGVWYTLFKSIHYGPHFLPLKNKY